MPNTQPKPITSASQASRERILATAAGLFASHGYPGVGMREVAARTGLSKSALFHHFPTKLRLYGAVLRQILDDVAERLELATADGDDPMAQLQRWIECVIDALASRPVYAPLLLRALFEDEPLEPADTEATQARLAEIIGRGRQVLTEGMAQGRFRRASVSHTLQSLIGMTVFHFASGDFGAQLLGESVFAEAQVERRKQHVVHLMQQLLRVDG